MVKSWLLPYSAAKDIPNRTVGSAASADNQRPTRLTSTAEPSSTRAQTQEQRGCVCRLMQSWGFSEQSLERQVSVENARCWKQRKYGAGSFEWLKGCCIRQCVLGGWRWA